MYFKIISVSRPITLLRVFLMERSGCPTKGGNWQRVSLQALQSLKFPVLCDITPHQKIEYPLSPLITGHILEKKVSLIAFR